MKEVHECDKCNRIDKWMQHRDCTPTILENYKKLLAIVKRAHANSCCICCDSCLACDALDVLKEIGEE
jgi:hypothetical protein